MQNSTQAMKPSAIALREAIALGSATLPLAHPLGSVVTTLGL
nr:hypothetical protein [Trichocoleus desertorum]